MNGDEIGENYIPKMESAMQTIEEESYQDI
jgi:hypothetical protein